MNGALPRCGYFADAVVICIGDVNVACARGVRLGVKGRQEVGTVS